jgi:predicted alpha/beta superfamily hydrolase
MEMKDISMIRNWLLPFALAFSVTTLAWAADPELRHVVLRNTQIVTVQSKITGKAHELIVMLPDSYSWSPGKKYPVLYFLDAYWDVPLMSALHGSLVYDKMMPECIMVGLSYPDGTDYSVERMHDYTYTAMAGASGSGKGDQFLDFIRKEAAPLIETTYRADPTNRVLVGASLGGLFALGAALKDPDFFNGYVAVSPAVVWDNGALFKLEEAFAKQNRPLKARMFISAGSLEPVQFRGPIELFEKQIGTHGYKGLELQSYTVEGTDHGTVKPESYLRGLKWVWQGRH